jgi:capsular polysaccharide biosynthesis protein
MGKVGGAWARRSIKVQEERSRMELRQYWGVIWRRRWLVLAIAILAGLFSIYSFLTAPRVYESEATFAVRFAQEEAGEPNPDGNSGGTVFFNYADYYKFLSSEYLVDDFTQIIESDAFGRAVIRTMQDEMAQGRLVVSDTAKFRADLQKLRPRDIVDMVGADRRHRELRVFAAAPTRDMAVSIMGAAGVVLTDARYEPIAGQLIDRPVFAQLDEVNYNDIKSSTQREITNTIVRFLMGLVAAIAVAFLLEYLDNSVRDERDARKVLDLPVIGAIPKV